MSSINSMFIVPKKALSPGGAVGGGSSLVSRDSAEANQTSDVWKKTPATGENYEKKGGSLEDIHNKYRFYDMIHMQLGLSYDPHISKLNNPGFCPGSPVEANWAPGMQFLNVASEAWFSTRAKHPCRN